MSIVLHGFGLGETIEQAVASTGIENLFVVDFSAGQRKPTAAEFRRFKRLVAAMQMGGLQFRERKGKKGGIEYWAVREPMIKKAA